MARTKIADLRFKVRPATRMVLQRMTEQEDESMTEVMEQAILDRARRDYPEIGRHRNATQPLPACRQSGGFESL